MKLLHSYFTVKYRDIFFCCEKHCLAQHWAKYSNFTYFSGVEILRNGTFPTDFQVNRPKLFGDWDFLQNFYARKLGEIKVFYAVQHYHCTSPFSWLIFGKKHWLNVGFLLCKWNLLTLLNQLLTGRSLSCQLSDQFKQDNVDILF